MKDKSLTTKIVLLTSVLLCLNLLFLFYLKYSENQLSLNDFSFSKSGNIINSIFILAAIIGLVVVYYKKIKISIVLLLSLIGLIYFLLFIVVVLHNLTLPRHEYYLYSLSLSQVIILTALAIYQFVQLFLIMWIWLRIFKVENLIYLRASVNSIFIVLGFLIFTLIFINSKLSTNKSELKHNGKSDVAVVLGAAVWSDNKPSPSLARRVDRAADLYLNGYVKKIQLTGGNAPGELSEAEVALNYISEKKINKDDIWSEIKTTSTIEQVKFIKDELIDNKHLKSIIIISDVYHLKRVQEICNFYNISAQMVPSDLRLKTDKIIFYQLRECIALMMFWLFGL